MALHVEKAILKSLTNTPSIDLFFYFYKRMRKEK